MLNFINLAQSGGELFAQGLDLLQQALQFGDVSELTGSELGEGGLGGIGNLSDAQVDGEALQVVEVEVEGIGVLLGQGLTDCRQVQLLGQALDKLQVEVVVAHQPVNRVVHVYVVVPQDVQTALHLIHN